jgi:hypothetical protein
METNNNISEVQSILDKYNSNRKKTTEKKTTTQTDLTKYFNISLPDGQDEGTKTIRIIDVLTPGQSPFNEVYFHNINVAGKWRKFYDPYKNEKKNSPLHNLAVALSTSDNPDDKKESSKWYARPFIIVKVIDRQKENEGPKFWRFSIVKDGTGVMDKLVPLIDDLKTENDPSAKIWDNLIGRDIKLFLKRSPMNKKQTIISQITLSQPKPLHSNEETAKAWSEDTLTWSDVYKKYSEDYLQIIAEQKIPMWSEEKNCYVAKEENDENSFHSMEDDEMVTTTSQSSPSSATSPEIVTKTLTVEDLPL